MTVFLAMQLCQSAPKVYGFDANSIPFHYYDPPDHVCDAAVGARLAGQGGNVHNFDVEKSQLRRWHDDGRVTLWQTKFTPSPNDTQCDIPETIRLATRHHATYSNCDSYSSIYKERDSLSLYIYIHSYIDNLS